jgi:hypothetical protein
MREATADEALKAFETVPEDYQPRKATHWTDWGDPNTRFLCIKSADPRAKEQFGRFLGEYNGEYYIGIRDWNDKFTGFVAYPNLEAMKAEWTLD